MGKETMFVCLNVFGVVCVYSVYIQYMDMEYKYMCKVWCVWCVMYILCM